MNHLRDTDSPLYLSILTFVIDEMQLEDILLVTLPNLELKKPMKSCQIGTWSLKRVFYMLKEEFCLRRRFIPRTNRWVEVELSCSSLVLLCGRPTVTNRWVEVELSCSSLVLLCGRPTVTNRWVEVELSCSSLVLLCGRPTVTNRWVEVELSCSSLVLLCGRPTVTNAATFEVIVPVMYRAACRTWGWAK